MYLSVGVNPGDIYEEADFVTHRIELKEFNSIIIDLSKTRVLGGLFNFFDELLLEAK